MLAQPTVNPLRFRQLAHTRRTNPRPAGPRPGQPGIRRACRKTLSTYGEEVHFAPEYTEKRKRIKKKDTRDMFIVPSIRTRHALADARTHSDRVSTSPTFHETLSHIQVSTHTHTRTRHVRKRVHTYTRVYKNGEHNEILRRCARARVVTAA